MLTTNKRLLTEYLRLCVKGIALAEKIPQRGFWLTTGLSPAEYNAIMGEDEVVIPYVLLLRCFRRIGARVVFTIFGHCPTFQAREFTYASKEPLVVESMAKWVAEHSPNHDIVSIRGDLKKRKTFDIIRDIEMLGFFVDIRIKTDSLRGPVSSPMLDSAGVRGDVANQATLDSDPRVFKQENQSLLEWEVNRYICDVISRTKITTVKDLAAQCQVPRDAFTIYYKAQWPKKCRILQAMGANVVVKITDPNFPKFFTQHKLTNIVEQQRDWVQSFLAEWSHLKRLTAEEIAMATGKTRKTINSITGGPRMVLDPLSVLEGMEKLGIVIEVSVTHPSMTTYEFGDVPTTVLGKAGRPIYAKRVVSKPIRPPLRVDESKLTPAQRIHIPGQPMGTRHFL